MHNFELKYCRFNFFLPSFLFLLFTFYFLIGNAQNLVPNASFNSCPNPPAAAFSSTGACLGNANTFFDASFAPAGDPLVLWSWSMPGGNPATSSSMNPSTTYPAAGTYSVTLVVTTLSSCTDTVTQQVIVYNLPVANFSYSVNGNNVFFTDVSTTIDGFINQWSWSFPGGFPSSSNAQNTQSTYPNSGTFTACLTIWTNYSCADSTCQTINILSVSENYLEKLVDIFPNPSNGIFSIKSELKITSLEIENILGEKIYSSSFTDKIDLSDKPNGVYLLRLQTEKGPDGYRDASKKIIIQK